MRHPITVVGYILPHIIILGAFGAFVLWNDGVVLGKLANYWHLDSPTDTFEIGHKEFHTAGAHFAQMLYIWPYFVFFSWPILIIPALNVVLPQSVLPKYLNYGFPEKQRKLPGILACLIVLPIMLAIVHFNTIVHPFTLADNRHYVFYVFRLLLGVHPAIKYVAVAVYFLCGWAVISAFGFSTTQAPRQVLQAPATKPARAAKPTEKEEPKETRKQIRAKAKATPKKGKQQPEQKPQPPKPQPISPEAFERMRETLNLRKAQEKEMRVSFVLVWIAATALSLVTAPLVEPRYFIIPWVMWRLHLPSLPTPAALRQRPSSEAEKVRRDIATNLPKFLETVWFMAINAITGYVFLYKGFEWPQEPGKIQRFMW